MAQRKAVVPIKETFVHHGTEIATLGVGGGLMVDNFKLTKEDIDKAMEASAREEYGYDVVPGPTRRRCFVAGLKAIGIEVE